MGQVYRLGVDGKFEIGIDPDLDALEAIISFDEITQQTAKRRSSINASARLSILNIISLISMLSETAARLMAFQKIREEQEATSRGGTDEHN